MFYVFSTIWMKFGMWTANAPALLLLLPCSCIAPGLLLACSQPAPGLLVVCSCFAPETAHPTFAAFIIISTLRLFSARREPPFMIKLLTPFHGGSKWQAKSLLLSQNTDCKIFLSIGSIISKPYELYPKVG